VDYARRVALLDEIELAAADRDRLRASLPGMLASIADGRAKLYLTWRALQLRARHPALFEVGDYTAVEARGERSEHVCAFARRHEADLAVLAVGRWYTSLPPHARAAPASFEWGDTTLALPPGRYRDVLTEATPAVAEGEGVRAEELFAGFPVALLIARVEQP
jgi:(1->4)-alpha-D-glucan 1-alpha-D-glucosylmutase